MTVLMIVCKNNVNRVLRFLEMLKDNSKFLRLDCEHPILKLLIRTTTRRLNSINICNIRM